MKWNRFFYRRNVSRYKISSLRNEPPVTNVIDVSTAKTNVLKDHTSSLRNKLFVTNIVNIVKDEISILIEESNVWRNINILLYYIYNILHKYKWILLQKKLVFCLNIRKRSLNLLVQSLSTDETIVKKTDQINILIN